jgi:two-component sensor histidine kinase
VIVPTHKPRILAIDDTPANLMTLGSALEDEFELQFATSGRVGLALALVAPPELILLDIMMPEIDGFATCELLKAEPTLRDVPIIFVTALNDPDSQTQGLSLGAADYITKPIQVDIARQRIRNLIEREHLRTRVELQRDALELALQAKRSLLHEIHHRVKSNLQIISSLLRLESGRAQQAQTRSVLHEMQGRIRCMALLHETLNHSGSSAVVDLGSYLENLSRQVFRLANTRGGAIRLCNDIASISVGIEQAACCGLWVNELLANALRHGFTDGREGVVCVGLRPASDCTQVHLSVSDNGVGMAVDTATTQPASLGLQLVSDLSRQIGGTLNMESVQGTKVSLSFAIAQPRRVTPAVAVFAGEPLLHSPI